MIEIEIERLDERWNNIQLLDNLSKEIICTSIDMVNKKLSERMGEISILLSNNDEIQKLNSQWRNKDSSTNVLSFQYLRFKSPAVLTSSDSKLSFLVFGDIVLSFETIENEAKEKNISFKEHYYHLLVHGVLHLLGYDHIYEKDAVIMEKLEDKIMLKFGYVIKR